MALFSTVLRGLWNDLVLGLLHACSQMDVCFEVSPFPFLEVWGIGIVLKRLWRFGCQKQDSAGRMGNPSAAALG
jgi:hypothetical protein